MWNLSAVYHHAVTVVSGKALYRSCLLTLLIWQEEKKKGTSSGFFSCAVCAFGTPVCVGLIWIEPIQNRCLLRG